MATKSASVKVSPLADRVVVRALEETEQMRGGLYIPDTAKEKPQQGEIVAVGPGRFEKGKRVPMDVKVGDKVLYGKYSGTEVTRRWRAVSDPPRDRRPRGHRLIDCPRSPLNELTTKGFCTMAAKNSISTSTRARRSSAASTSSPRR